MIARSFVLFILVAMAFAVPGAPRDLDSRISKLEKKLAALAAKTEFTDPPPRAARRAPVRVIR